MFLLRQESGKETFSNIATEVDKLMLFFSFSYCYFEDTVTNYGKDMFRNQSLT